MAKEGGTALAVSVQEKYSIILSGSTAMEKIRENLGGEELSVSDIGKVEFPSGRAAVWQWMSLDGIKTAATVEGIILYTTRRRAHWESLTVANSPPDCRSDDMITGVGKPGGSCELCPLNRFGSGVDQTGKETNGKRCKERRLVFFLRPGSVFPEYISIPPASLKSIRTYLADLGKANLAYYEATTIFGLKPESNNGTPYSVATCQIGQKLDPEFAAKVKVFADSVRMVFEKVTIDTPEPGE